MNTKLLGRWGEALAADYLRRKGHAIIGMGYTTRLGEIDVISKTGRYVVFTEVKLRKSAAVAEAREFVDKRKIKRVIASASLWLQNNDVNDQPRFDVIEIYAPNGADTRKPRINHIENAFGEDF